MAKLVNLIIMMSVIAFLFNLFGLVDVGQGTGLIGLVTHPYTFNLNNIFSGFVNIASAAVTIAGIVAAIGTVFYSGRVDIMIGILGVTYVVDLGVSFLPIVTYLINMNYLFGILFGGVFMLMFAFTIVEWMRLRD